MGGNDRNGPKRCTIAAHRPSPGWSTTGFPPLLASLLLPNGLPTETIQPRL